MSNTETNNYDYDEQLEMVSEFAKTIDLYNKFMRLDVIVICFIVEKSIGLGGAALAKLIRTYTND